MYGLERVILTSLAVCFMYIAMKPGMIFFPLRLLFEKLLELLPIKMNLYLRHPFFNCIICMSSVYGILFTIDIFSFSWQYLLFIFQVGGLNFILSLFIHFFHDRAEEDVFIHKKITTKEEEKVAEQL